MSAGEHHAYGLQQASGVRAGSAHYVLQGLVRDGYATSRVEAVNARDPAQPPRTLYRLTDRGQRLARTLPDPDPVPHPGGLHAL